MTWIVLAVIGLLLMRSSFPSPAKPSRDGQIPNTRGLERRERRPPPVRKRR